VDLVETVASGATIRALSCAHVYAGISAGLHTIRLNWKTTGGTATLGSGLNLLYEIIEYD